MFSSLRSRLFLLLGLAMAPVIILVGVQTQFDLNDERQRAIERIYLSADEATDVTEQTLSKTSLLLRLYASQISTATGCSTVLPEVQREVRFISNAVWVDSSGQGLCSAIGTTELQVDPDIMQAIESSEDIYVTDAFFGSQSERWIFAVFLPVRASDETLTGAVAFSLDAQALTSFLNEKATDESVRVALVDSEGQVIGHEAFNRLPDDHRAYETRSNDLQTISINGQSYGVVRVPLGPANMEMLVAREQALLIASVLSRPVRSVVLPASAILLAALSLWWAIEGVVIKYLRRLQRVVRIYGAGRYALNDEETIRNAPDEISELAKGLAAMSNRILERETDLENALAVRDGAIKEVHHRVKNNLQIVSSFLSLEARASRSKETQTVLAKARTRISALSIVHQTLYQHERLDVVALAPFLETLLEHLDAALGLQEARVDLRSELAEVNIPADDAIPIALIILELITNSLKYAFQENGGILFVRFAERDETYELTVQDDGPGVSQSSENSSGLGSKLLKAFTRQLKGDLKIETDNGRHTSIVFPKRSIP
jgi:two-component sensor histidine kinase